MTISCLLLKGDTLIVGGAFNQFGGVARSGVALVHRQTGQVLGLNAMTSGGSNWVSAMARSGNTLYVGGSFTMAMGQPRANLCAINLTTGALAAWNPGTVGRVRAMAVDGAALYIGGEFTAAGGSARTRLAALNLATGVPTAFNPTANSTVWALAISNGQVYVGGQFTTIGGQPRNRLAQVSTAGTLGAWNPNADLTVWALVIANSTIYAGGGFSTVNGTTHSGIAALGEPGSAVPFLTTWDPGCTGSILALAAHNGRVYAGGQYINIGILKRSRLAAFDITTGEPTAWNPGADGSVFVLAIGTDVVYVGGNFTHLGGAPRTYLGAVHRTNDAATAWDPAPVSTVQTMLLAGNSLYVGGSFNQIGGSSRLGLAELSTSTGLATSWVVSVNGSLVRTMLLSNDTLFIGGSFTEVNGTPRTRMAAVLTTTGALTPFDPAPHDQVSSLAKVGSRVFVSGQFTSIGGQSLNFYLAAVNSVSGALEPWTSSISASQKAIAANDRAVFNCGNGIAGALGVHGLSPVDGSMNGFMVPTSSNETTDFAIGANDRIYFVGWTGGGTFPNYNYSFHSAIEVPDANPLGLRVFLEGPYDSGTGLLTDALRTLPTFPTTEPFTALGYAHVGGGGGETCPPAVLAVTGNNAIVDWVLVELRDPGAPQVRLYSRSALLQRDGDIVGMNGTSGLVFNAPTGNYHVAVRHRNHLGVMSLNLVPFNAAPTSVDFSLASTQTYGTDARKSLAGTFPAQALWAGDVTFNDQVKYSGSGNDRDPILVAIGGTVPTNTLTLVYRQEDITMNGVVRYAGTGNDRDILLQNIGGSIPTATRSAQLP
ncbi:MAG: delta-60 repeat domain-containing protein [Flavobacteriales bacterium]|nr:delta-60 repeat domain-containing protein [Flavobacteriales bacterium]